MRRSATPWDTWTLSDVDAEWINLIEERYPAVHRVLLAALTDSDKSYLAYMAARLLEMPRLLKPTGSVYLHCDPTMSHYLKLLMDAVFGRKNFRTEIVWKRTGAHSDTRQGRQQHGRVHDVVLYYSRSAECWTWNPIYTDYDPEYVRKSYRHIEEGTGRRYRLDNLTGPGGAAKGNPAYEVMGVTRYWRYTEERMAELIAEGRVVQTRPGGVPAYKRYLDEMPGVPLQDVWADLPPIGSRAKERVGYPTQKPLALLERIILASTNGADGEYGGDVVLDPFCGCATTLVAADRLQRQWVGIDLSPKAAELVVQRVEADQGLWRNITHREDAPQRTDLGKLPRYNSRENREALYGRQAGDCAGCREHFHARHLEVDHIIARARGGTDHLENLQLLCGSCNRVKGERGMEYLRSKLQLTATGG